MLRLKLIHVSKSLDIKITSHQYIDSHYKDKTVSRPSYLFNANPNGWKVSEWLSLAAGKTVSILRRGPGFTTCLRTIWYWILDRWRCPVNVLCKSDVTPLLPHRSSVFIHLQSADRYFDIIDCPWLPNPTNTGRLYSAMFPPTSFLQSHDYTALSPAMRACWWSTARNDCIR